MARERAAAREAAEVRRGFGVRRGALAILLRVGVAGQDVVSLSQALLVQFDGLLQLSRASAPDISRVRGMGATKAATIKAGLELGRRMMVQHAEQIQIHSPQDVATLSSTR